MPTRTAREQVGSGTVAAAVLRGPKVSPASMTAREAGVAFADDHVHALLVVEHGVLLAVVERADLVGVPGTTPAALAGRLAGRTVGPGADLAATWADMAARGRRRLAVVDRGGVLVGLLCLKRAGHGFCSDADVAARAADRQGRPEARSPRS